MAPGVAAWGLFAGGSIGGCMGSKKAGGSNSRSEVPAPALPRQRLRFTADDRQELQRLGLLPASVVALERMLRHIATDLAGDATTSSVLDSLTELRDCLRIADRKLSLIRHPDSGATGRELRGLLGLGSAHVDQHAAVRNIETADETVLPHFIDVPTLVRLCLVATERALQEAPVEQSRHKAPWPAVDKVYRMIWRHQPDFPPPTVAKNPTIGMQICSVVFDASGVAPRSAQTSAQAGIRGDVDKAIRAFKQRRTPGP